MNSFTNKVGHARVIFYTTSSVFDMKNLSSLDNIPSDISNIDGIFIESTDIISINTTTSITESAGNFSIKIRNTGLRYLADTDMDLAIKNMFLVEEPYRVSDNSPDNSSGVQSLSSVKALNFNYFKDKTGFLGFKYEFIEDPSGNIPIFFEITPQEILSDNTGDTRRRRWFFEKIDGVSKPVIVNVTQDATTKKLTYTREDDNRELSVKYATANDLYSKYGGSLLNNNLKIHPMDQVYIFMSNKDLDEDSPDFYRVFTGVVNKVGVEHSNEDSISIEGEDISKYLRLSVYATQPSLYGKNVLKAGGDLSKSMYMQNPLADKTAPEIIRDMVLKVTEGMITKDSVGALKTTPYTMGSTPEAPSDPKSYTSSELKKLGVGKELFYTSNKVFIQDPTDPDLMSISQYRPYKFLLGQNLPDYQTKYSTRKEVCAEVSKIVNFEFFADPDGNIEFRQPHYSIHRLLSANDPSIYILNEEDMRSISVAEDDNQLMTYIRVTGSRDLLGSDVTFEMEDYSEHVCIGLLNKFGVRLYDASSALVAGPQQCNLYAKSLALKINADYISAQASLNLRPALRPGNPVYVPRFNMIFYIISVSHSFVYGGDCTTSVGLQLGRAPWDIIPELLTYYKDKATATGFSAPFQNITPDESTGATVKVLPDNGPTAADDSSQASVEVRYNSDVPYIVFHHANSLDRASYPKGPGRTFDFIISSKGIWTTPQWIYNLAKETPMLYNHLATATHNPAHLLTTQSDYRKSIQYLGGKWREGLARCIHIGIEEDLRDKTYWKSSGELRADLKNNIISLLYNFVLVANNHPQWIPGIFKSSSAEENMLNLLNKVKSHHDFHPYGCTGINCCGFLYTDTIMGFKSYTTLKDMVNLAIKRYRDSLVTPRVLG